MPDEFKYEMKPREDAVALLQVLRLLKPPVINEFRMIGLEAHPGVPQPGIGMVAMRHNQPIAVMQLSTRQNVQVLIDALTLTRDKCFPAETTDA